MQYFQLYINCVLQNLNSPSVYGKVHESLNFAELGMENLFMDPAFSLNLVLKKFWLFLHEMVYTWRILKETRQARKQLSENLCERV